VDEAVVGRVLSRDWWIGIGTTAFALGAMAVDHLLGTNESDDEPGEGATLDYGTFAISAALTLAAAAYLFGRVVPNERGRRPQRVVTIGLLLSVVSIVPGVVVLWLGFPFVVAGAGIALGIAGLGAAKRWKAIAAIVLGALVIAFGAVYYVVAAVG
jgi:O-antigen ligase